MTPTRWTVIEAGEEIAGPIRLLDWQNEREVNCVRKTWIRSLRVKPEESKYPLLSDALGKADYWQSYPALRDRLMSRADVRVAVSGHGSTVLGWACVEPHRSLIHYVFVQQDFRRRGIAKQLLADFKQVDRVYFTHRTYDGASIVPDGWTFSFLRAVI